VLTKPTDGTFNRLTVKVNGGPDEDAMDSFPIPLTFDSFSVDNLTDDDLDAIIGIIVNRIRTVQPDYTVTVSRAWTGARSEPFQTVYTPPPADPPTE
jgi:hypothetical protein